jgi:aryl-alcohol dehydrogenase-like predicted oxidoreductase
MKIMKFNEERVDYLADNLKIHTILNGMWQVSGGHGQIDFKKAIESMEFHVKKGFITWDLADHYGPAEDLVKIFREKLQFDGNEGLLKDIQFFTKWVPRPQNITRKIVKRAIDISRKRMGMESLDMVQFHWWDYDDKNYLKAIEYLDDLREEGIIKYLGLTNFDTLHLKELVDMGFKIISNQVQYSLIDRRPEKKMCQFCEKNGIKLLAYGTLGGGLLSERYLDQPEPHRSQLYTTSLQKYKRMVDLWGNWNLFQQLLKVLYDISKKYSVSIANVAVRYILENFIVGGAIIGVRLGISENVEDNLNVFKFTLENDDLNKINEISEKSNDLFSIIGDCGDEYR